MNTPTCFRNMKICFLAVACLLCVRSSTSAQTVFRKTTQDALNRPVTLRLGRTTLDAVMKELSKQTGLTIECADYLREHRLTMQMKNQTGADALNQIAELTNAVWTEAGAGRIRMARERARIVDKPTDIPRALRAVLSADVLRYCGYNVPSSQWRTEEPQALRDRFATFAPAEHDESKEVLTQIQAHLLNLQHFLTTEGWTERLTLLKEGRKYQYRQWTREEQEKMVALAFASCLSDAYSNSKTLAALKEQFPPYLQNPMQLQFHVERSSANADFSSNRDLRADLLMLGTRTYFPGGYQDDSFGVNLYLLTAPGL